MWLYYKASAQRPICFPILTWANTAAFIMTPSSALGPLPSLMIRFRVGSNEPAAFPLQYPNLKTSIFF